MELHRRHPEVSLSEYFILNSSRALLFKVVSYFVIGN